MRLIVFFDLPVESRENRIAYSSFRKFLIKQGYLMMQYSIYTKIFNNQEAIENHLKILSKKVPNEGSIRAMMVTEKQYSKIVVLLGTKTLAEERENMNSIIEL